LSLRCADLSKLARPKYAFIKWTDFQFQELFKEGDFLKSLSLPVSKYMDRENCHQDKLTLAFIDVLGKPFLGTFLILSSSPMAKEITDGLDGNRKLTENKVESAGPNHNKNF
jgi:hypothetical protein